MSAHALTTSIKNRLPPRTDLVMVFSGCAFVVHAWAIYNMLEELPAWILRMGVYELAGVISYVLVFALLESLLLWGVLVLLAAVLPRSLLREGFAARGTALVLASTIWSIGVHLYYGELVANRRLVPYLAGAYLLTALAFYMAARHHRVESALRAVLERLEVLAFVYVSLGVLGLLVVIVRNL